MTITIDPLPVAPSSANSDRDNFCTDDTGDISLSAIGGSGSTLQWFDDSCGGTPVGTGTPLVLPSPSTTTTYFARWENGCGESTCASVTVTVLANPAPIAMCQNIAVNIGGGGIVTVNAGDIDNGSSADASCGQTPTLSIAKGDQLASCSNGGLFSPSVDFACNELGPNIVTLRVEQTDGQTACCLATVTVSDPSNNCGCAPPTAPRQPFG